MTLQGRALLKVYRQTADKRDKEPALRTGTGISAAAGVLSLIAFLWPGLLSERTSTTILIISAFALPIVTAILTRNKVWSPAAVVAVVEEAVKEAEEITENRFRPDKKY